MLDYCRAFSALYREKFSDKDFILSLQHAKPSLHKIFNRLFFDGVTLGRVTSMYAYGAFYAEEYLKRNLTDICFAIPCWINEYVITYLKPRLITEKRWDTYERLFHLYL